MTMLEDDYKEDHPKDQQIQTMRMILSEQPLRMITVQPCVMILSRPHEDDHCASLWDDLEQTLRMTTVQHCGMT